jgi:excisionase family DNA binding protein
VDRLLLTPTEAAAALGIGRSKLYELMRMGVVTSVRIGGCRRVPAASLSELVARLQVDGGQEANSAPFHRPAAHPQEPHSSLRPLRRADRSSG